MFGVRLFPPQVLSDLNFFNVSSKEELATRLRAVQRVAAAAIGIYLKVRYQPILAAKWESKSAAMLSLYAGYSCLSCPVMLLVLSWFNGYVYTMDALSCIRSREIGWTVLSVSMFGLSYFLSQNYKDGALTGPNLLEKLFDTVEDKLTQPLWDRFYKKN